MQIITKNNINKTFFIFLFVHLIVWTLIPSISNNNLPLDTIEAFAWGSNLDWGFNKHPPLSAFAMEVFYQIFGNQDWAFYFLSQLFVISTFIIIWIFSKEFFQNQTYCLISVLLLEGIYFYNFTTPEFNVNVCLLPFWALSVLYCWKGLKDNKTSDWLLLGIFAGLGVLSKYLFIYLGLAFDLFLLYMVIKKKINFKCLISIIPFLLVLLPHLIWLTENDYITITYGLHRTGTGEQNFLDHIIHPLTFLGKQIGILIPFFIMFLFTVSKIKIKFNFKDKKLLFLLTINIAPVILMFLTSMILGVKIRTMWMTPFYLFFGVLLVYIFQQQINLNKLKSFTLIFLTLFIFSPFAYAYISIAQTDKRTDYDGKAIASILEKEWKNYTDNEIISVVGDEWVGGNLVYQLKPRPRWYDVSKNTLALKGGLVLVNHPKVNCNTSFEPVFKSVKFEFNGTQCFVMYRNK